MNARDALEVVRRLTGGYKDREHALASGDVPIALAAKVRVRDLKHKYALPDVVASNIAARLRA